MYAEQFGVQNPAAPVEAAAKWVQWAQAGIQAGALEHEADIRYNLDQWWKAKAPAYAAGSGKDRADLDRLDTYAYGIWNALEAGKVAGSSPSYWDYFRAYIGGGVPANPDMYKAASAAALAAQGMQTMAKTTAAESPSTSAFGTAMAALGAKFQAEIPGNVSASQAGWKQEGKLPSPLGIPLWGWALGVLALGVVIYAPSPRRN